MEPFDPLAHRAPPTGEDPDRPFKRFDRETEMKIYGVNACRAVFAARPTDIIRCYHFAGDPRPFAILGRPLPL